jgi:hypothetical protein
VKNGAHPVFEAKSIHQSIIASVEYNVKGCDMIFQNESPLVLVDAENGSKGNGGSELTKNREIRSAKIMVLGVLDAVNSRSGSMLAKDGL